MEQVDWGQVEEEEVRWEEEELTPRTGGPLQARSTNEPVGARARRGGVLSR